MSEKGPILRTIRRKSDCSGQQEPEYSQGRLSEALGSWGSGNLEGRGRVGEGWGKWGQFTSNLRPRWTIPVTAGGCQVSKRGYKGETKGELAKGSKKARGIAPCIYVIVSCMQQG